MPFNLYVIKNTVNDKIYIGQTTKEVEERFNRHKNRARNDQSVTNALYNAFRKYGTENFYVEKLCNVNNMDELNELEEFLIQEFNSLTPNGYNVAFGGNNKLHNDVTKAKQSVSSKIQRATPEGKEMMHKLAQDKWDNPEYRAKMKDYYGSDERKELSSNVASKNWDNPEYRAIMKDANCKKILDTETGVIYNSITELSNVLNKERHTVSSGIKNGLKLYSRYVYNDNSIKINKQYLLKEEKPKNSSKKMLDTTTGITYTSIKDGAKKLGISYVKLAKGIKYKDKDYNNFIIVGKQSKS